MINKLHSESRLQSAKPDHDYVNEFPGKAAVHSDVAATVPVMVNAADSDSHIHMVGQQSTITTL